jgi:hypothetical protein
MYAISKNNVNENDDVDIYKCSHAKHANEMMAKQ